MTYEQGALLETALRRHLGLQSARTTGEKRLVSAHRASRAACASVAPRGSGRPRSPSVEPFRVTDRHREANGFRDGSRPDA